MTFIEQSLSRQASALRLRLPGLYDCCRWVSFQISRYYASSESGRPPTSSALILFFTGIAAVGADAFRSRAPAVREWTRTVSSEPEFLLRKAAEFHEVIRQEMRLHQEICGRLFAGKPLRIR